MEILEFKHILQSLIIIVFITSLLMFLSLFFVPRYTDKEKLSAYECGFQAFQDARMKFDVNFYLIALLFLIFDLEMVYLISLGLILQTISVIGLIWLGFFLFILTLGFVFEWVSGALDL